MTELTDAKRRKLKGEAHHLTPVVNIGKEGVSEAALGAVAEQLLIHELIKVKLLQACPQDKGEAAEALSAGTGAALVQLIGRTVVLYKPRPPKKKPEPKAEASATAEKPAKASKAAPAARRAVTRAARPRA